MFWVTFGGGILLGFSVAIWILFLVYFRKTGMGDDLSLFDKLYAIIMIVFLPILGGAITIWAIQFFNQMLSR